MKFWLIFTAAAFWAAITHAIWGFYPVTIAGAVIGAIGGALATVVFGDVVSQLERDEQPDEMEHLPNDPPVKTSPRATLCWDDCGRIAPFPDVLCPQCRKKYPWLSQE